MDAAYLSDIASQLATPGKGILASDESTGTIGKRLEKAGLKNDEETRRAYRELFYTADIGHSISGAIMFKETLYQSAGDGRSFVQCLREQGVLPGIKVDEGLVPLEGFEGETSTRGLASLEASCREYVKAGAKFAKWRAALRIGEGQPSERAVQVNAEQLAEYALICQALGLVPIVEPEVLIEGAHSAQRFAEVSERVISACVAQLWRRKVLLEGCLLKPQMVIQGAEAPGPKPGSEEVAELTLRVMRRTVPAAVPGIMFLSGGQSEQEATTNLNTINRLAQQQGRAPWSLSFSFGRALQASVLQLWSGDQARAGEAKQMAAALARANGAANLGKFVGPHPSLAGAGGSLHETCRGWRTDVVV